MAGRFGAPLLLLFRRFRGTDLAHPRLLTSAVLKQTPFWRFKFQIPVRHNQLTALGVAIEFAPVLRKNKIWSPQTRMMRLTWEGKGWDLDVPLLRLAVTKM